MDFTEDGNPYCKELRLGLVDGEPVVHVAVCPFFQSGCYRATRFVMMSEWHLDGNGRHRLPVIFHTSHPQLAAALMRLPLWVQKSAVLYRKSGTKFTNGGKGHSWYGGYFRAVQGFAYMWTRDA